MREHLYIDETKARDYLMLAAVVLPSNVSQLKRDVRKHFPYGNKSSFHMTKEIDSTRKNALKMLRQWHVEAVVFDASRHDTQAQGRTACLQEIARYAVTKQASRIVFDRDDTLLTRDRRDLRDEFIRLGSTVEYVHTKGSDDALLWIPDALAWAYAKGGVWRPLVKPCILDEIRV